MWTFKIILKCGRLYHQVPWKAKHVPDLTNELVVLERGNVDTSIQKRGERNVSVGHTFPATEEMEATGITEHQHLLLDQKAVPMFPFP